MLLDKPLLQQIMNMSKACVIVGSLCEDNYCSVLVSKLRGVKCVLALFGTVLLYNIEVL